MKILALDPSMLGPQAAPGEEASSDHVLYVPIPSPDDPGEFVLMTLTPEGRPVVALVDSTVETERGLNGYLDSLLVVSIPKEAPWLLVRRNNVRFITKSEARRRASESMRSLLDQGCPIHGDGDGGEPVPGEGQDDKGHGTYL